VVEANRLWLDGCGFTREEVIGRPLWACGWWNRSPELMGRIEAACRQAAAGQQFRTESRYFVSSGAERIVDLVLAPVTDEERIVADAYAVSSLLRDTSERSALLRLERELVSGQTLTKSEWARQFGNLLLKVRLYTPFAQTQYEGDLFNALLLQRRIAEKAESRMAVGQKQVERPFQYLEEDPPLRGVLAFFRTGYRNHINLSAIADNKAHIMISVNSILISVLISAISYHNMAQTNPGVLLPVVIFLVTGLASLTFAVLAARPKVTMFNRQITDKKIVMKNMIFFGNFVHLKLEDYEEMLDEVFRDSELMYGNMSRDLYFLGQVLDKKYRYLTISYNIFMMGFVATVLTFLFTLFSR
nr:DUF5706 domain-containing protein [Ferruginibacter sp.]